MKYFLILFAMLIIVGCNQESNGITEQPHEVVLDPPNPVQGETQVMYYVWTNDFNERGMFRTFQHPFTTFFNIETLTFIFPKQLKEDVEFNIVAGNEPNLYLEIAPTAIVKESRIFRKIFEGTLKAGKRSYSVEINNKFGYKYYYINLDRDSLFPTPATGYITSSFN